MATNNATNTVPLLLNGQLLIGSAGSNPSANTLIAGPGITILNTPGNIEISAGGAGGFSTVDAVLGAYTLSSSTQYITDFGAPLTYTLPAIAAVGDTYRIIGKSTFGWTVAQNIGQQINVGDLATTVGLGGSVSSNNPFDCITIVCVTANTEFVSYGVQGNLTVI